MLLSPSFTVNAFSIETRPFSPPPCMPPENTGSTGSRADVERGIAEMREKLAESRQLIDKAAEKIRSGMNSGSRPGTAQGGSAAAAGAGPGGGGSGGGGGGSAGGGELQGGGDGVDPQVRRGGLGSALPSAPWHPSPG